MDFCVGAPGCIRLPALPWALGLKMWTTYVDTLSHILISEYVFMSKLKANIRLSFGNVVSSNFFEDDK